MKESFNGKIALVTGAGSGMGLATAKAFVEAGASVVLADIQGEAVRTSAEQLKVHLAQSTSKRIVISSILR